MKQINKDDDNSYDSQMASNDYSPQSHVNGISNEVKELQLFLESDRLVCFSQLVRYIRELELSECSFSDAQKVCSPHILRYDVTAIFDSLYRNGLTVLSLIYFSPIRTYLQCLATIEVDQLLSIWIQLFFRELCSFSAY